MTPRFLLVLLLVGSTGLALAGCGTGEDSSSASDDGAGASVEQAADRRAESGRARAGEKPPVVIISIDTLRSDFLPAYGYEGVDTPALDRFAADAVVFDRAYSHYPLTFPSHVSILTGRLPASAGVRGNSRYRLASEVSPYLPASLRDHGYATAGAVSTFVLRSETGLSRGFDAYFDHQLDLTVPPEETSQEIAEEPEIPIEQRAGSETLDAVMPWLAEHAEEPFFLFLHIYEPHLPHTPPEPFRTTYGDTYEGEIAASDHVVGRLLDELRRLRVYERALIFVLSDHGEEFGEHGEEGHGLLIYRQSLQVPLLMKLPQPSSRESGVTPWAGSRFGEPVQLADLVPTVFDVLGLGLPDRLGRDLPGESLLRLVESGDAPGNAVPNEQATQRTIFSETLYPRMHYGWHELTSVIQGEQHLISGLHAELFDLAADPAEENDVLKDRRREYRALDALRQELAVPYERPTEDEDPETKQRLASLGYLSSSGPTGEPTRDPREVVPKLGPKLKAAEDALRAKNHAVAAQLYEELVAIDDGMPASWQSLGMARMGLEDYEGAFEALEKSLRLDPLPSTAQMAARCLLRLDRLQEAEEHALLAVEGGETGAREVMINVQIGLGQLDEAVRWAEKDGGLESLVPPTLLRLAKALVQDGRPEPARRVLEVLTQVDPSAASWNERARLAIDSGDPAGAREAIQQAMAIEPRNAGSLEWLGLLALQQGRLDEAGSLLQESLSRDATSANAWNLLAVVRFQRRDSEGALGAWQEAVRLDPGHLDALYNLGLTAARMGRRDLALRSLRQYAGEAKGEPGRAAELAEVRKMITGLEG